MWCLPFFILVDIVSTWVLSVAVIQKKSNMNWLRCWLQLHSSTRVSTNYSLGQNVPQASVSQPRPLARSDSCELGMFLRPWWFHNCYSKWWRVPSVGVTFWTRDHLSSTFLGLEISSQRNGIFKSTAVSSWLFDLPNEVLFWSDMTLRS